MQNETNKTQHRSRDARGRMVPGHSIGLTNRWREGISGNPAGVPAARRRFEAEFYAALIGEGSPEEAANLLWEAAREKEPWAVQALLARLAPQETKLKISTETNDASYNLAKLTDTELDQFIELAGRARVVTVIDATLATPGIAEGRESSPTVP
jgi:hypothetical protein